MASTSLITNSRLNFSHHPKLLINAKIEEDNMQLLAVVIAQLNFHGDHENIGLERR
jgi:hypothetical protein